MSTEKPTGFERLGVPASARGPITIGIAGLALFVLVVGLVSSSRNARQNISERHATLMPTGEVSGGKERDAWYMAQDFVKRQLKAPKSAEFPPYDGRSIVHYKGNNTYTVGAYVDSQNSFGALLRKFWVATVRCDGEDRWSLVELQWVDP